MMERNLMSLQDDFEFKDYVPREIYIKYFDTMKSDGAVYVCLITNEDQVGAIYLERPMDAPEVDGVVRVFFNPSDLKKYTHSVAAVESIPVDMVKKWEMKFSSLIDYMAKLDTRNKTEGSLGVRAIASAVYADKFLDIDTMWTSEPQLMV